jgi:aryl-alcohol dehydrogenase-like predicted oxidoreductase
MAALGRPGYINLGHGADLGGDRSAPAMRRHAHDVLDAAWAGGVRHIDVARSYGRAEEFLGGWLAGHPEVTGEVFVSSKWGYTYTADWQVDADVHEVKDHSVATYRRQIEATRNHLGDHLDLYQIHSATLETGVLEDATVLSELVALRASGVGVGLTTSGPGQAATIERACQVEIDGVNPFGWVQATYNVLEPSAGNALERAHHAGWRVIVKEALANARLTDRGDPPATLSRVASRHGVGVDAVAIAAVLAQPFVDVVLSGATTVAQLESNLRAATVALEHDELDGFADLAEPVEDYWDRRSRLAWT